MRKNMAGGMASINQELDDKSISVIALSTMKRQRLSLCI